MFLSRRAPVCGWCLEGLRVWFAHARLPFRLRCLGLLTLYHEGFREIFLFAFFNIFRADQVEVPKPYWAQGLRSFVDACFVMSWGRALRGREMYWRTAGCPFRLCCFGVVAFCGESLAEILFARLSKCYDRGPKPYWAQGLRRHVGSWNRVGAALPEGSSDRILQAVDRILPAVDRTLAKTLENGCA